MAYENLGILSRNLKQRNAKQPSHTGKANIGGKVCRLAGYPIKNTAGGISVTLTWENNNDETQVDLFRQSNPKGSRRPDYIGTMKGVKIAGWIEEMKKDKGYRHKGDKFLSLKFTLITAQGVDYHG